MDISQLLFSKLLMFYGRRFAYNLSRLRYGDGRAMGSCRWVFIRLELRV